MDNIKDPYFQVRVVAATRNPNRVTFLAMHQDYSEGYVGDEVTKYTTADEPRLGKIIVERLLANHRGHFGCLEHPSITFAVGYYPHSVMQQLRTHRVGVSFDVQSTRYTGDRILNAVEQLEQKIEENGLVDVDATEDVKLLEKLFYLKPPGEYRDRHGAKYHYSEKDRLEDLRDLFYYAEEYVSKLRRGYSHEHARLVNVPYCLRQHFVMSCNARSLMHILDLRSKMDAEEEIRILCSQLFEHFRYWMPEVAEWYANNRMKKARLAP